MSTCETTVDLRAPWDVVRHRAPTRREDWSWDRRSRQLLGVARFVGNAVVEVAILAAFLASYITVVAPFAEALFLSWPALVVVSGLLLLWRWR